MKNNPVSLLDPSLPSCIREALIEVMANDDVIFRVETDKGIEWWLMDKDGELIESFWVSE